MIAVIGTAGRDKSKTMDRALWAAMVADALGRIPPGSLLVSGGAAWADHIAVELFLCGHVSGLRLHLPSEFRTRSEFAGGYGTAGGASNHYHRQFSKVVGRQTIADLAQAVEWGAEYTTGDPKGGMGEFFTRNRLVAQDAVNGCVAYTWGDGEEPADGGTLHTWRLISGQRQHVSLQTLAA